MSEVIEDKDVESQTELENDQLEDEVIEEAEEIEEPAVETDDVVEEPITEEATVDEEPAAEEEIIEEETVEEETEGEEEIVPVEDNVEPEEDEAVEEPIIEEEKVNEEPIAEEATVDEEPAAEEKIIEEETADEEPETESEEEIVPVEDTVEPEEDEAAEEPVIEEETVEEEPETEAKEEAEEESKDEEEIVPVEDTVESEEDEEEDDETKEDDVDWGALKGEWYILHVYSNYEEKIKLQIEQCIKDYNLQDKVFKVLIPEEDTIEIKNNKRVEKRKKVYPGYIFINMLLDDDTQFLIRRIQGVSKFVGGSMPEKVMEKDILRVVRQSGEKVKAKLEVDFEVGEGVKVISGPFRGYTGSIKEINLERGKAKVLISIFGRETPMELEFDQLEKNG